jgi:nucleotide-binding universal stress UspA family protein
VTEYVGPVVVGTDFSDASTIAVMEARRLAAMLGAQLDIVHVADGGGGWTGAGGQDWLDGLGLSAEQLIVRFGSPWVELARYAAEVTPTLLVVGSHGASGYQPLGIGSTAARVAVQARFPVVVVSPRLSGAGVEGSVQERSNASRADAVAGSRATPGS